MMNARFTGVLLGAALVLQLGCATILTGTRQKVAIRATTEDVLAVAVSGPAGQIVRYAQKGDRISQEVFKHIGPHLPPDTRRDLAALELEELVARLAASVHTQMASPDLAQLRIALAQVPQPLKEAIFEKIGLAFVELAPATVEVQKGTSYVVIAWRDGHRASLVPLDAHLNWVFLLNVLTLGIGFPVDVLTGAWLNVGPSEVQLRLNPR